MVSANEARGEKVHLPPSPFIVGVGRSGTTLLRLMLDAHPEMAIPPETHFIPKVVQEVRAAKRKPARIEQRRWNKISQRAQTGVPEHEQAGTARREQDKVSWEVFVDVLTSWRTWGDHNIGEEELRQRISAVKPFSVTKGLRVFYGLYADKFGKTRWGDKTPGYGKSMSLIQRVLPEARFVYLIRDGRDVALSIKDLWFGPNSVEEAAEWWKTGILAARSEAEELPGSHYMEVRYEDLISEPESVLKEVCAFVDLPWNPCMLEYHIHASERIKEIGRDVVAPKGQKIVQGQQREAIHSLTGKPPQHSRIGRWRREMEDADRARFEETAGDLLENLGYPLGGQSGRATR